MRKRDLGDTGIWGGTPPACPQGLTDPLPPPLPRTPSVSRLRPVPARAPAFPASGNMSEGVDLIDIYADEEFTQVRGGMGVQILPLPSPFFSGRDPSVLQLIPVEDATGVAGKREGSFPIVPKSRWLPPAAVIKGFPCGLWHVAGHGMLGI